MTTPARPELPEPELGYIETDKSRQPAFSAAQMRAALQSAQPAAPSCVFGAVPLRPGDTLGPQTATCLTCGQPAAAVSDGEIVKLAFEMCSACYSGMDHQFAGMSVVKFARAILALRPQAVHPDTARCIKARNDLNAALHGEGALIDDLEHAVANACAKLLRPQAVPMTEEQIMEAEQRSYVDGRRPVRTTDCWGDEKTEYEPTKYFNMFMFARNIEAFHRIGITQRADGGEQQA